MGKNRWVRKETNMYDYIIVGAGSAGCVLANRLTEDPETSVLVLEAGGNDDLPAIHDPAATTTLRQSAVDWAYSTEEEPHLNNRKISVPRGKVLGGSSSINFMVYVRGNRADYDQWQALEHRSSSREEGLTGKEQHGLLKKNLRKGRTDATIILAASCRPISRRAGHHQADPAGQVVCLPAAASPRTL